MDNRRKVLDLFIEKESDWKSRVENGIERYRKGNAKLTFLDESGAPVKNARIKVKQISHEFRFGANIFMLDELETSEKNEAYKQAFANVFNMATIPFYWDTLEPQKGNSRYEKDSVRIYRRPSPDKCLEFCKEHGIEPREHALSYEAFFPTWLYGASVEETKKELERRFLEISSRYANEISTIEVTNEMFWAKGKTAFYSEPDFVEWNFKLAEKYFPNNHLSINEGTCHCWEDDCCVNDKYYSYVNNALLKGARIDAIGMQYHLFYNREEEYEKTRKTLDPDNLFGCLDLYSTFNKPLQITEVTIPAYSWEAVDEEIQADIIEKLYATWFSYPNVEQIIYWNLVDGYAHLWEQDLEKIKASQGDMTLGENYYYGGLLRFDLTPKPAYYKIKELIQEKWHTETELITDENGNVEFRGFYGLYEVEIAGKKTTKFNLSSKSNATETIKV